MRNKFKEWFKEIEAQAIADKKMAAEKEFNDPTQWKRIIWRAPMKNHAIKAKFRDEGYALGYKSRPSYITNASEWLYDFVWRNIDANKNLLEVILTMEIELSDLDEYSHRHDFNKLLQADSPYKIFVFQAKTEADVLNAMAHLKNAASKYRFRCDSEFFLCAWCTSSNSFLFDEFNARAAPALVTSEIETAA